VAEVITRDYIRDFFKLEDSEKDIRVLDFIMSHLVLKEYSHNSYICYAGDEANSMYFLEAGIVGVMGPNDEWLNELVPGRYFGEYAALTGEKRMAAIQAKGEVQVYELDKKVLQIIIRAHPGIYGLFLKNVYDSGSERYRNLVRMLNSRRGIGFSGSTKKFTFLSLFINYYLVFLVFFNVILFAPRPGTPLHPFWMVSPIVFLVGYIVITRRVLESIVLATIYVSILSAKLGFIGTFFGHIISSVSGSSDLILTVVLMGSLSRLFTASGSINALRQVARQRLKTARGTLFTALCATALVSIDEYLSILINGSCFTPLADQKSIPREKSSLIMGMSPMAICILNPISLSGLYLTGVIASSGGQREFFVQAIRYNFTALIALFFILLLVFEKMPLASPLKKAAERVKQKGILWPEGTENIGNQDEARGRIINMILPVVVLVVSSIAAGTVEEGRLSVNVLYGLIVTLIVSFLLYCFQRYMTPEQYFNNLVHGIENMLAPVVMFVMGKCFAAGIEGIGFSAWLNEAVQQIFGGQAWLMPALIFGFCALIGALFDNPWAMYAVGMPIAIQFAYSMQGNPGLYVGAVCAAGFIGNELALGDIFFIGSMLGCNPMAYYRAKLPYVIVILILAFGGYAAAGYLLTHLGWQASPVMPLTPFTEVPIWKVQMNRFFYVWRGSVKISAVPRY
jgi:Na+/H+ antiporter NhaC